MWSCARPQMSLEQPAPEPSVEPPTTAATPSESKAPRAAKSGVRTDRRRGTELKAPPRAPRDPCTTRAARVSFPIDAREAHSPVSGTFAQSGLSFSICVSQSESFTSFDSTIVGSSPSQTCFVLSSPFVPSMRNILKFG